MSTLTAAAPPLGAHVLASGPAEDDTRELFRRWLALSELQRRAFIALCAEVAASSQVVEDSALDLSERFQELAAGAQAQTGLLDTIVAATGAIVVDDARVPLSDATASIETVLTKVVETILVLSKHAMEIVHALDDALLEIAKAEQSVTEIETLNRQSRMLALNARIEAERAGPAGRTFGVIAREVGELARSIDSIADSMRGRVGGVAGGIRGGHAILRTIASIDLSEHILAKEQMHKIMAGLTRQSTDVQAVLHDAKQTSAAITETIARLITRMQFQDRTKQHLDHVIDTLDVLGAAVSAAQAATRTAVPTVAWHGEVDEAWVREVVDRQTLGGLRKRFVAQLLLGQDDAAAAAGADDQGSVELF